MWPRATATSGSFTTAKVSTSERWSNVAKSYCNIGVVYDSQGQYERALEYYQKA
jgi:tetratricopeptide (TPR) repeat protein